MKQVIQNLRDGKVDVIDVPVPQCGRGKLLVATSLTLISAGTERMLLSFGKANWLQKARQQPDKVRMVLEKAKTDGIAAMGAGAGELAEHLYGADEPGDSNAIEALVVRLRRKMCPQVIETRRGFGYLLAGGA